MKKIKLVIPVLIFWLLQAFSANAQFTVSMSYDSALCSGSANGSAIATITSGGIAPFQYVWTDSLGTIVKTIVRSDLADTLLNVEAGLYHVTITDDFGGQASIVVVDSVYVIEPNELFIQAIVQDLFCFGDNDGAINGIPQGGTGPFTFEWSNGSTTQITDNLIPGTYTLTLTDANGCSTEGSYTVSQPTLLTVTGISTNIPCNGFLNGTIDITATGGTTPYTYVWNDFTTNEDLSNLDAGTYTVIVSDENNCTASASFTITQPDPLVVTGVIDGLSCYGDTDGSVDITVTGGTTPYTYNWSNGATTEDISTLIPGYYFVTVTDANGCVYEFDAALIENAPIQVGEFSNNVTCYGATDGSASVSVSGGVQPYTYLWSNGGTTDNIANIGAGNYCVTISDAAGCVVTYCILVTEPALLDATYSVVNLTCHGSANGVATVNAFGGVPPYTYSWNSIPIQTNNIATGLKGGNYTCTIIDSVGCIHDVVLHVYEPDSLYGVVSVVNVNCNGGNNGEATVVVAGGTPGYSFLWSDGQTTGTAVNLAAGNYIATITDANGCQIIQNLAISQPNAILITLGKSDVTCFGGNNGQVTSSVTGGTGTLSYLWNSNPGQTTSVATGLPAGTYTLVVTDQSGCMQSASITVNEPLAISDNPTIINANCNGASTGSISLAVSGGTSPYSILWSTGSTVSLIGGLAAGTYSVTITDANGCVSTNNYTITQPAEIVISPTVSNAACFGSATGSITVSVSGGTSPFSYVWNNGGSNATNSGLVAGTYYVTVTDANLCTVTASYTITQPTELGCVCNTNVTNVSCFGGSNGAATAIPTGGTAPYTYSWIRVSPTISSVLATTQSISGLTAGVYQVTITDANGCITLGNVSISEPSQLLVFVTPQSVACNGGNNGQATALAFGGSLPYSYSWSTFPVQTNSIATGLNAGSYSVIVTDAHGCTASGNVSIGQPAAITLTKVHTNTSCFGGNDGTATITATGGTPTYTYLWSNGKTSKKVTGLKAKTYTVTVTDHNGCTKSATITVNQPTQTVALYVVTKPLCNGGSNGSIDMTVTGGTPGYTYLWSNGATTQDLINIIAGTYFATITDSKGCVVTATVVVAQPTVLTSSITKTNVSCFGGSNGSATVNVTGGKSPYTYLWSNGQSTATANNLLAGSYNVTITDANGCTKVSSIIITQPASALSCNTTVLQNVLCFGGSGGRMSVTPSGGTPPYTYSWNTAPIKTTAIANNVPAGTYSVLVTDAKGCTTVCSATITQPASGITLTMSSTNTSCFGSANGTASVSAIGGTAGYSYLWNTGVASTTDNISGLSAGTYTVTVTDANGCTKSGSVTITQLPVLVLNQTHTNILCNGGSDGTINGVATGGLSPYTYTLNPGGFSNGTGSFTGLTAGTYTLSVSDEGGCTASVTGIIILEPVALTMSALSGTDVVCFGASTGTATAGTVAGGTLPYTYSWSTVPVQATVTAVGLVAGSYSVVVSDAHGCTVSGSVTINQPLTSLSVNFININNIGCNGSSSGSATANANGGTAPYSYLWSNGTTTATATGLSAGTYFVSVTDANGCQMQNSINILQAGAVDLGAVGTDISCHGGSDGFITATATGGNAPYLYSIPALSYVTGTGVFTSLGAGTYRIFVVDANGCGDSVDVAIGEPSVIIMNTSKTNASCFGGSNGKATAFPAGGVPPYAYLWNNGAVTQQATGLTAAIYTVMVTDAHGCTLTATANVGEPAQINLFTIQTNNNCSGSSIGSATVFVNGGISPYNYFWSNGQMNATASNLASGIYTVTVTDFKGCTSTTSVTIFSGTTIIPNPTTGLISCYGGTTAISVNPAGGSGSYSYIWSHDVLNFSDNAVVGAGTYCVTISDNNGCSTVYCFSVTQPNQVLYGSNSTSVSCNGLSDGIIQVTASGGTTPYDYAIGLNHNATGTFTGLSVGSYTVDITDANSCTNSATVIVTQPDPLQISMSSSPLTCSSTNGELQVLASGGTAPYTYLWSNGVTTYTNAGLAAGTYTVTVNDAQNCGPLTASISLIQTPPLSCSATATDVSCAGYQNGTVTVNATGGAGGYTYLWVTQPVQTNATAIGLGAGTYSVIITDLAGCTTICSATVNEPAPLVYSISQNNVACAGNGSGSATINVFGGTTPYSYLWDNGQTTAHVTNLSVGATYVTVTDANGCSFQACVIMTQSTTITCNTSSTPASCGQANGTATVNVFGGTAPYSYQWNNGQNNQIATGLVTGLYAVVVTDANGCTTSCTAFVYQPVSVVFALSPTNALCNDQSGTIAISGLSGGLAPYSYQWSNGSTDANPGPLAAGTYTLTVSDVNGCSSSATAAITQPDVLSVNANPVDVSCNGGSNGSATAVVSGGTAPYSYDWSSGGNLSYENGLAIGSYTLTVTDNNGCTQSASFTISEPSVLDTLSTSSTGATCNLANGTGTVTAIGGTPPYSYSWNTNPVQTTQTATGLSGGVNSVTVTDANGCSINVAFVVPGTTGLNLSLQSAVYAGGYNIRCNGGSDGSVNLTVGGSAGPFTYSWSNGSTTEDLFAITAGTYTVLVSDGSCTGSASVTLTQAQELEILITHDNVICYGTASGSATANVSGGVAPFSYVWSNGQTGQSAAGLVAGTYTVTASDANGCTSSNSVVVGQPANGLSLTATEINPSCYASTNGSIDITASGGTPPYSYLWVDGETTEDRTGLAAGSWNATVTDATGCNIQFYGVLIQPNLLVVSMSSSDVNCSGGSTGTAAANAAGGNAPYSYNWSTGSTASSINNLAGGVYTVTVTDLNGCTISGSVSINQINPVALITAQTDLTYYGGNNGTASVSASGGIAPYSYSWNTVPVKTTASVTGLTAGSYVISVTDSRGCVAASTVIITQPDYVCSTSTAFRTETPSSWVVTPNGNPSQAGQYLSDHFASAFPGGLVVGGGGCLNAKTLTLTSVTAVRDYLVNQQTTGSGTLILSDLVDPTSVTFPSVLAANCVALTLNTVFDNNDANFAPVPTVRLQDMIYNPAPFTGMTVAQILADANKRLGSCGGIYSATQFNTALSRIDSAYKGGLIGGLASSLSCPGVSPRIMNSDNFELTSVNAFPNPTTGLLNITFNADADGKVVAKMYDLAGRELWNVSENAFVGDNARSFDFSQFAKGIYLMNISVNDKSHSLRIVIQ